VLAEPPEREHESLDQPLFERVVGSDCSIDVAEKATHLSLQHSLDELVLAGEVLVDGHARHPDPLRHLADREPAHAELLGLPDRLVEDPLAGRVRHWFTS
jgi:hypothetical protein